MKKIKIDPESTKHIRHIKKLDPKEIKKILKGIKQITNAFEK